MSTFPSDLPSTDNCAFVREATAKGERVHVYGDVDLGVLEQFERVIGEACGTGGIVSVDLRECSYMGAAAFDVLQRVACASSERVRVVVSARGVPARLLAILRSQAAFAIVTSL